MEINKICYNLKKYAFWNSKEFHYQVKISNYFNNYFATIAKKKKETSIPHSNIPLIFLKPGIKTRFFQVLPMNHSVEPNSIPIKILSLLKNDIYSQLADTFNIPFSTIVLDKENIGCGIFADLQKTFDTVEHDTLLAKFKHNGIHGMASEWFKSYLFHRK